MAVQIVTVAPFKYRAKKWLIEEGKSFLTTMAAVLVVDELATLASIYGGDFSRASLIALGTAVVRSMVKALFQLAIPAAVKAIKSK